MKQRKPGCICELNPETNNPLVEDYAMCPVHRPNAPDPKQEAKNLIQKMMFSVDHSLAKDCAIVCVDELLFVIDGFWSPQAEETVVFYKRVREELSNL